MANVSHKRATLGTTIALMKTRLTTAIAMPNKITIQVHVQDAAPRKSLKPLGLMLMELRSRFLGKSGASAGHHRGALDQPSLREVHPSRAKRVRD
jgi:hypothetical protein